MSNGIKVVKRNGSIESIDLEKMHKMVEQAREETCTSICQSG